MKTIRSFLRPDPTDSGILRSENASLTMEAALSMTLFLLCGFLLMTPLLILSRNLRGSVLMEEKLRKLSILKYGERFPSLLRPDSLSPLLLDLPEDEELLSSFSDQGMKEAVLRTESEGDMIRCSLRYDAALPFPFLLRRSIPQELIAGRRAFVGADPARWKKTAGNEAEESLVYISVLRPDVYHLSRDCSYISNAFLSCPARQIDGRPARYGGRFSPCRSCRPSPDSPLVYYTEAGRRYHSSPDCPAMQSYVSTTTLERAIAAGRHPCIRCGR